MFLKIPKTNTDIVQKSMGFTLVEVLVSMSLFTIVVTMSMGTLLVLIDANAKQQNIQTAMTNLSFALDSMTREIRTGYSYQCGGTLTRDSGVVVPRDCSAGGSEFAFTETGGSLTAGTGSSRIAYRFNSAAKSIERRLGNTTTWQRMTAPEVVVDSLEFIVTDSRAYSDNGNMKSPTVTIFLSGTAGNVVGLDSAFEIQTTVTQQLLDL